jgi:hypothetical protein
MSALEYIRMVYGVPAYRGALVRYGSSCGTITLRIRSAKNARLYCSPKDADPKDRRRMILHPTWHMAYLSEEGGQPSANGAKGER